MPPIDTDSLNTEQDIDLDKLLPEDPPEAEKPDDIEIDVVDDTPEEDRARQRLNENPDPTDDELAEYSEKVQKRIKKLQHGYHDERREKEQALRERDEAVRAARAVWEQMQQAQGRFAQSEEVAVKELKTASENKLKALKEDIKRAYNEGDAEKIADLTELIADEKLKVQRLNDYQPQFRPEDARPAAGQAEKTPVYTQQPAPQSRQIQPDARAESWRQKNTWFGKDRVKTATAMGVHEDLVVSGIDPTIEPDTYYRELDKRLSTIYPDLRADDAQQPSERRQSSAPVASVSRGSSGSRGKTRVQLTQSQLNIARSLGVPPEEYARQMVLLNKEQR